MRVPLPGVDAGFANPCVPPPRKDKVAALGETPEPAFEENPDGGTSACRSHFALDAWFNMSKQFKTQQNLPKTDVWSGFNTHLNSLARSLLTTQEWKESVQLVRQRKGRKLFPPSGLSWFGHIICTVLQPYRANRLETILLNPGPAD